MHAGEGIISPISRLRLGALRGLKPTAKLQPGNKNQLIPCSLALHNAEFGVIYAILMMISRREAFIQHVWLYKGVVKQNCSKLVQWCKA